MVPALPSVHQDVRVVSSDEVGVRPCRVGEPLRYMTRLATGLRTLQSHFPLVLWRGVSERLSMTNMGSWAHLPKNSNREITQLMEVVRPMINLSWMV